MGDLISLFLKFIRFGRGRHPLLSTYKMGTSDCQKEDPRMGHDYDHDHDHKNTKETFLKSLVKRCETEEIYENRVPQ